MSNESVSVPMTDLMEIMHRLNTTTNLLDLLAEKHGDAAALLREGQKWIEASIRDLDRSFLAHDEAKFDALDD